MWPSLSFFGVLSCATARNLLIYVIFHIIVVFPFSGFLFYEQLFVASNGEFWQTTRCYFKPLGSWLLVSFLTFTLYCFTFLLQIYFWYISVNKWKKAYTLIQYLPITCAMAEDSLSDLHVLMAKISENDGARKVSLKIIHLQNNF